MSDAQGCVWRVWCRTLARACAPAAALRLVRRLALTAASPQGLGVAWLLHAAGITSNLIVIQTRAFAQRTLLRTHASKLCPHTRASAARRRAVLLPLTLFDHEVVRLHLRRDSEAQPALRRPFATEPEKMAAMCVAGAA
jgi:hypothetical protein